MNGQLILINDILVEINGEKIFELLSQDYSRDCIDCVRIVIRYKM